jgi:hypothetical protein
MRSPRSINSADGETAARESIVKFNKLETYSRE